LALLLGVVVLNETYWWEDGECVDDNVEHICMFGVDLRGETNSLN
jgi:hypothetical protein